MLRLQLTTIPPGPPGERRPMKEGIHRTTVDLPVELYRRCKHLQADGFIRDLKHTITKALRMYLDFYFEGKDYEDKGEE